MVFDYYHLREQPFGVTPDPGYLYLGETHREAFASLLYGIESGCGFVVLIAKPGLGKTTLLRHSLNQLREKARTVYLFQTMGSPADLLRALLSDLGVQEIQGSLIEMQSRLNDVLVEQANSGKRLVVVVDEAQNLDDSVLELLRMLSNFETSRAKLIQVVLAGQPELADKIGSPQLLQLRQRISIFARLNPLSAEETSLYINHRLRVAGYRFDVPLFTESALALIAEHSEGIPRNINNLCFNALSLGFALKRKTIDCDIINEVIGDLDIDPWRKKDALVLYRREPEVIAQRKGVARIPAWLAKAGIAAAISAVVGGALYAGHLWQTPVVIVQADRVAPPPARVEVPAAVAVVSHGADRAPSPSVPTSTIQVAPGETLFKICVEHFGGFTPEILKQIHDLNPGLGSPDHIESGQTIRIPVSGAKLNVAEQHDEAPLADRSMQ